MAFRPFITPAMERATWLTRLYGQLLLIVGLGGEIGFLLFDRSSGDLIRSLIIMAVMNVIPGILLLFVASRMDRVALWAFIAVAFLELLLVVQMFLSLGYVTFSKALFLSAMCLRIPLIYLIAATINALPQVLDGYAGYRREKQMMRRAFEPIMNKPASTTANPPPPSTSIRLKAARTILTGGHAQPQEVIDPDAEKRKLRN